MTSVNTWLMKSEPDVFSIDDLRRKGTSGWDGVRNYQARNFLRAMRRGDRAFFYHSNSKPPALVGLMEVVREAYPDPTQFDRKSDYFEPAATPQKPRWDQVDVKFVKKFSRSLCADEIRQFPILQNMVLLKNSRLSVQPVTAEEFAFLLDRLA